MIYRKYCEVIHDEYKKEYSECRLCNEKLEETKIIKTKCCDNPNLINDIRRNCGTVDGYLTANEFVDCYENYRHRIRRKSIYLGKYRVKNILNSLCQKYGIEISYVNRQNKYKIFQLIDQVLPQVNSPL